MPRKKLELRRINVNCRPIETVIVEKMEEDGLVVGEIIRQMIREYGEKHYPETPAYAEALLTRAQIKKASVEAENKLKAMSAEEYTMKVLRAKVKDHQAWFKIVNGQEMPISLADIKQKTVENSGLVKLHAQLLDRKFVHLNGQVMTESDYDWLWKDWDAEGEIDVDHWDPATKRWTGEAVF